MDGWYPDCLDINLTGRCSLKCSYCYLGKLNKANRGVMSPEVAEQVLEYTARLARHHEPLQGSHKIQWNLFGGEPFNAFGVVMLLVTEAQLRGLPVDVHIFTNGATATAEQVAWCRKHGITPHRSTCGCPESCAKSRPGEYLERYEAETLLWEDWHLPRRVTVTPDTAGLVMQSLKYIYLKDYWGGVDFVVDAYGQWSDEAIATFKEQLTRLAAEFVRQFKAGHVLYCEGLQKTAARLFGPPTLYLGCGAGWGTQAITWDGYLMPCHRFLREPRQSPFSGGKLADLLAGKPLGFGAEFTEHVNRLAQQEEPEECQRCPARQSCSHGCYHISHLTTKDLKKSPRVWCEVQRHYVELARWVNELVWDLNPQWYDCEAEKCEPIPEDA